MNISDSSISTKIRLNYIEILTRLTRLVLTMARCDWRTAKSSSRSHLFTIRSQLRNSLAIPSHSKRKRPLTLHVVVEASCQSQNTVHVNCVETVCLAKERNMRVREHNSISAMKRTNSGTDSARLRNGVLAFCGALVNVDLNVIQSAIDEDNLRVTRGPSELVKEPPGVHGGRYSVGDSI